MSLYIVQDRKYIDRFQSGDYEGFNMLYEKYIDRIFAFIYRKTSDRELAEDITSQVWIKVLKSLEYFGEKENAGFKSWLYCVANNTVIDHYRTKRETIDIQNITEVWISDEFANELDNKDKLEDVLQYMKSLKPLEREIVTLRIWDDMSYKQIAKIVWKKPDNCKKILSRALGKIAANVGVFFFFLLIL